MGVTWLSTRCVDSSNRQRQKSASSQIRGSRSSDCIASLISITMSNTSTPAPHAMAEIVATPVCPLTYLIDLHSPRVIHFEAPQLTVMHPPRCRRGMHRGFNSSWFIARVAVKRTAKIMVSEAGGGATRLASASPSSASFAPCRLLSTAAPQIHDLSLRSPLLPPTSWPRARLVFQAGAWTLSRSSISALHAGGHLPSNVALQNVQAAVPEECAELSKRKPLARLTCLQRKDCILKPLSAEEVTLSGAGVAKEQPQPQPSLQCHGLGSAMNLFVFILFLALAILFSVQVRPESQTCRAQELLTTLKPLIVPIGSQSPSTGCQ